MQCPDLAACLVESGEDPVRAIVSRRNVFGFKATLDVLARVPDVVRLSVVRRILTKLFLFCSTIQNRAAFRNQCIRLAGDLMEHFVADPILRPSFNLTMREYCSIAMCFGASFPPECVIRPSTAGIPSREYVVFWTWHVHAWCGVSPSNSSIEWRSPSAVLVREFCTRMVWLASSSVGYSYFPRELTDIIARYLV